VRHYDPSTLHFIELNYLDNEGVLSSAEIKDLVKIVQAYSFIEREQVMMFVYADFFTKLFDRLAAPATLKQLSREQLSNLLQVIGYLTFVSPGVEAILNHAMTLDMANDATLSKFWVNTVMNLRVQESNSQMRDEMVRLAAVWQEHYSIGISEGRDERHVTRAINTYVAFM